MRQIRWPSVDGWCTLLALLLLAIASVRIVSTSTVSSATLDETLHLGAGMEWLDQGKYRSENEQPPLARIFAAVGPYLAGERWHGNSVPWFEGDAILGKPPHYDRILALGRLGILPFFWVAGVSVFLWGRHCGGAWAGLIAVLLFTNVPPVLAHAGLITTDMALTAFTGAATYASICWRRKPTWGRTAVFGVILGLAALSKFSALVYLPAVWLLMYAVHLLWNHHNFTPAAEELVHRLPRGAAVGAVAFLVIWLGYRLSFGHVDYLSLRLPAPRFFLGLNTLWQHNLRGHAAYLLGRRSQTGFWYYYPVVLSLKTPLAMLVLAGWATFSHFRLRAQARLVVPFAFCLGILIVGMASRINIGVRHVLPIYTGLAVVCGNRAASRLSCVRLKPVPALFIVLLLTWHVVSPALQHPDYLAYTNELTGAEPERFLADSDLDWGQDMKRLGAYLNRAGANEVTFMPFNGSYIQADPSFPRILPMDVDHPSQGWNAVAVSMWKVQRFGVQNGPVWPDRIKPRMRIGRGILLWHCPPPALVSNGTGCATQVTPQQAKIIE